jgi:outer membrane receptor protein involved in Fe transport
VSRWRRWRQVALVSALASGWGWSAHSGESHAEDVVVVDLADLPPLPVETVEVSNPALVAAVSASEDLVTGAAKREQTLGNVASAVTVISRDRLRRFGYRTVAEAIAGVAGIHLVDDRLSTRVGIRGLQLLGDFNTRILVVIDGTSVTEEWAHLAGVGYDLPVSIDEIERIEVIRGPVSSIYGTNAFFGIINIITRGADDAGRAWGRITAASIGGGTATAGFALGSLERQVRGAVSMNRRYGERLRFEDQQLRRRDDAGDQVSLSLSGAYHDTFAQARAYTYERTIPFGPYDSLVDDPYVQTNQQLLVDVGHVLQRSRFTLNGRLYGSLYQFKDRASGPTPQDALRTTGQAFTAGAEVRGHYQVLDAGRLGVTAGLETSYNVTRGFSQKGASPREDAGRLFFDLEGLYAEVDSQPRPWLGLTAGVRLDRRAGYHQAATAEEDPIRIPSQQGTSPRLALFLSRGDTAGLKLLYARGFRNPSTYESNFDDKEDIHRNPKATPEHINSYEAVAWARPTLTTWLRSSAYYWKATDILKQSPAQDQPGLKYENVANYKTLGLELEASYRDRRGWYGFAGASLVRAEVSKLEPAGSEPAPGAPTWTASLGASSPKLAEMFHLSSELMAIGERPTHDPTVDARAFVAWNLVLHFPSIRGYDLTVGVKNALGLIQQVPAAEDFDRTIDEETTLKVPTVPGEGRELYVRLGYVLP